MRKPRLVTRALAIAGSALVLALAVGSPGRASDRPGEPTASLQDELTELAQQARPGTLGISIRRPGDGPADLARRCRPRISDDERLQPASTRHLLALLYAQTIPDRLRAGIPAGVRLADKCGTSYTVDGRTAAFNDMGILTWPDGHTVIVAAFLTDSHAPEARRNALFRTLARTVAADLRPTLPAARYDRARSSSSRIGHSGR
jgi:beta-lactamase class A